MWHLQFFAPALDLSVLAFQSRSSLGPFIVKPAQTAAVRFDEESLDEYLVAEWGLSRCSHQMANLVHLMEDKAVGCLLRMRAGAIAANGGDERARRQMA